MSSSTFGRRPSWWARAEPGALLTLPSAGAAGSKVAIPLAKLEALKSVGGSIAIKVRTAAAPGPRWCDHVPPSTSLYTRQCVVAFNAGDKKIKCPCHGSHSIWTGV